jgi:DNA-binding NtrC family response regulator
MTMPGSRLTVSGAEPQLANAIAGHLKKMGLPGSVCQLASLPGRLGPERDGLLVLAVASAADAREVRRLVQEIALQRWPAEVLVVATAAAAGAADWTGLSGHVVRRLEWPGDAAALAGLVWERLGRRPRSPPAREKPLPVRICQDFLRATPSLWTLADRLAAAAAHDVNVLIQGETGTGKSFLARIIHGCSPRKDHRFLVVPCGALVPHLIESELFGHVRGAFTGADRAREGRFAAAGRGTLLLDEIDALGLEQQANLLRVIETGEFEPVGSEQTQLSRARVIAASNVDLEEAVRAGKFRQDLYYRLAGMTFTLPPLRERASDIPPLARGLVARSNRRFNKGLFDIHAEALSALQAHPWPGNIRQLENALLQAVLYSAGSHLLVQHFPQPYRSVFGGPGG